MLQNVSKRSFWRLGLLVVLLFVLTACKKDKKNWELDFTLPNGEILKVDDGIFEEMPEHAEELDDHVMGIPVEWILYEAGVRLVGDVTIQTRDAPWTQFPWSTAASGTWLIEDGSVRINRMTIPITGLKFSPEPLENAVEAYLTDIAPTVAASLGLPTPKDASGRDLGAPAANKVALLFVDALGWQQYQQALAAGIVPSLAALDSPRVAMVSFPPGTTVNTASVLTGASLEVHGVRGLGKRETESETLFDVAAAADKSVYAIEGVQVLFSLRNATVEVSSDADKDGNIDDDIEINTLNLLSEGQPDVLWVHFHGIQDAGHLYGPESPQYLMALNQVDTSVGGLMKNLEPGTLVVIFSDHGLHQSEHDRLGDHANLIREDMLVPLWILKVR